MRLKPKEPELKKRIFEYRLSLPSNYEVSPVLENADSQIKLITITRQLYPVSIRPSNDDIHNWLDDISTMGYMVSNSQYPRNSGIVAAVLLGYNEDMNDYYHLHLIHGGTPRDRRDEFQVYYDCGNEETAHLWFAGVLPGDPNGAQIREGLVAMQNYLMWEGCFRELICLLSEHDPMTQIYQRMGYATIENGIGGDGDKTLYLTKDRITLKEYFQSLSALVGKEWLMQYLGVDAVPQEGGAR
jgi:hypothetical protein